MESFDIESLEALPELRYCCDFADARIRSRFDEVVAGLGLHNVFNPSFHESDAVSVFSFRAIPAGSRELTSYVSVEDRSGRTITKITPDRFGSIDAPRLIDPKVFTVGEEVYVTFNSGWMPRKGNDIFVMRVYPSLGEPRKLIYPGRENQERNWALFSEGGEVYAIYRIAPLVILRVERMSGNTWWLTDHVRQAHSALPHDLTLGTQPARHGGRYYFMAHRKYLLRRKKVYLGRLCVLDPRELSVSLGKHWMAHSRESLQGSEVKHNTNLFSCTYFSGLQASGEGITLGYGINDVDFGFSTQPYGALLK